jgi:hypothetical protein
MRNLNRDKKEFWNPLSYSHIIILGGFPSLVLSGLLSTKLLPKPDYSGFYLFLLRLKLKTGFQSALTRYKDTTADQTDVKV